MKVLTVMGARPQFIKAAPVSKALRERGHTEFLVHTGQHYDRRMSHIFFGELEMPEPDVNLAVGSGGHGWQTGRMLMSLEGVMEEQRPDFVLVYGDTNSTLAGALCAAKLRLPLAHVEAGLRSFNREMPEEHNRVLTDHCADLLLCPTQTAVRNLRGEGLERGVHLTGDTMFDAVLQFAPVARRRSTVLGDLGLRPGGYLLVTIHRPCNTDAEETLSGLLDALAEVEETVVFPAHPRTRRKIKSLESAKNLPPHLRVIEPVGYLDMLMLESNARMILTDSGGVQKEAYFLSVPCLTLRPETEWPETVEAGWNVLAGAGGREVRRLIDSRQIPAGKPPELFGNGEAAYNVVACLEEGC